MMSASPVVRRTDLVLPRFLATILFGLAAIMGPPVVASVVVYLALGRWGVALFMASVLPVVGMTVWLGRILWSGRPIPAWFVFALGGLILAVPSCGLLMRGEWLGALEMVAFLVPFLAVVWSGMSSGYARPGKPAKPRGFDDELA